MTSPNPHVVAVDVDGVLVSFLHGFERAFEAVLGRPAIRVTMHWDLDAAYQITKEDVAAIWAYIRKAHLYRELPPLEGAFEAVRQLEDAGYEVHAVTAIDPVFEADRLENLASLGFNPKSLHSVGFGSKTPALQLLRPAFFADDQVKHLHAAPFVPNRVWIRSGDEQFPGDLHRHTHEAHSLHEFVQHWLDDRHHHLEAA